MNRVRTVVFLSNYFNHHQKPFSDAMYRVLGDGYVFVETQEMTQERKNMGWGVKQYPSYVVTSNTFFNRREVYERLIRQADVVIFGSAPHSLVRKRIAENKLTFHYSERPLKKGLKLWRYPDRFLRWHLRFPQKRTLNLLCASAYTAGDYAKFFVFKNRGYKWGYFPEMKKQDLDVLFAEKRAKKCPLILWAGRLIAWKHPDIMVSLAQFLKTQGREFDINIIGNGELEESLSKMIQENQLEDCVHMLGAMSPEAVRQYMEKADIFAFTSDFNEGWGAVLNESMNSACAVVASHAIGSVPFLLKNDENGLIYKNGDVNDLCQKVCSLLDSPEEREHLGRAAYETLEKEWNADMAAERFLQLAEDLLNGKKSTRFTEGPCSPAELIGNGWYRGEENTV